MPVAAATTCRATRSGSEPTEREPIVGSPGPLVTSASGAKSTVKPRPRSSAPLALAALRVAATSSAAPALMNAGKRVASPWTRSTMPPSWSTDRNIGQRRGTSRSSVRLTERIWAVEAMLSSKAITPPRCNDRTSLTGAAVPDQSATITWPARSGRRIRRTTPAARSSSRALGPQPVASPSCSAGVGGAGSADEGAGVEGSAPGSGASPSEQPASRPATRASATAVPAPHRLIAPVSRAPHRSWCRRRGRRARRSRRKAGTARRGSRPGSWARR